MSQELCRGSRTWECGSLCILFFALDLQGSGEIKFFCTSGFDHP